MDSATAMQRLEEYEASLLNHIADEEDLILPLYRERAEIMVGGAPEIFSNEHAKLRTYVELFKAEMPKLIDSKDRERDTLWLLDSQNTFKRLLVHHDVRERKFLYPELDKVMTQKEKDDLFTRLRLRPVRSTRPNLHNVIVFERTLLS
jgi:hemerythrin-like domain-containing protein